MSLSSQEFSRSQPPLLRIKLPDISIPFSAHIDQISSSLLSTIRFRLLQLQILSFKMKGSIMAIISLLLLTGSSCSGRLLGNNLFIASDNSWAFNPNLNSVVADGSSLEKDGIPHCDHEISPWSSSSDNNATKEQKNLSFKLNPKGTQNENKADESPASNKAEAVFQLLPKGKVTPSGPSPKVNSMVTERRLSTSKRSPGVGHMQMIHPKSQKINGDTLKSHQSNGDDKRNKRKLASSPSKGDGH